MIVVDSSVWIDNIREAESAEARRLSSTVKPQQTLIGDLILLEVLRGARDETSLRSLGTTVRKTIDLVIGTFCIEHGHELLQNDRAFLPMAEHLALRLA